MLPSTQLPNNSRVVSGNVSVYNDDVILLCNTEDAPVTINLNEIPSNFNNLYRLYIKDNSNNAATNNIIIVAPAGYKINNQSSWTLTTNNCNVEIVIGSTSDYLLLSVSGVSSVGLTMPSSVFSVANSPVTSSGVLAVTFIDQLANKVFASPDGSTGQPTFRSLVAADLPGLSGTYFKQSGNAFGVAGVLGLTDNFKLSIITNNTTAITVDTSQNVGVGIILPTARLHVQGVGADLNTFALKVFNSATATLLSVRNDGHISAGTVTDGSVTIGALAGFFAAGSNTFVGVESGKTITSGTINTGIGYRSLFGITSGVDNVGVGYLAASGVSTGSRNVGIGHTCVGGDGSDNVGIGYLTLQAVSGSTNIGLGNRAGNAITSGSGNIAIGYRTLLNLVTGSYSTAVGEESGLQSTGSRNIFIGHLAGSNVVADNDSLFIDNQNRGSAALDKTNSLIYGVFNATPTSQTLIFNASVGVGVPLASLTAKLQIQGVGTSDTTYGLKVYNSTGSNNALMVRDDGFVGIGTLPATDLRLKVVGSGNTSATSAFALQNSDATGFLSMDNSGFLFIKANVAGYNIKTYDTAGNEAFKFYTDTASSNEFQMLQNGTLRGILRATGDSGLYQGITTGSFSVGGAIQARLGAVGATSDNSAFVFSLRKQDATQILYVRNDGFSSFGGNDSLTDTRVRILGTGTSTTTYGLQVHNSGAANNALVVRDDGNVGMGIAAPDTQLHINGANAAIHLSNNAGFIDIMKIGAYNSLASIVALYNSNINFSNTTTVTDGSVLATIYGRGVVDHRNALVGNAFTVYGRSGTTFSGIQYYNSSSTLLFDIDYLGKVGIGIAAQAAVTLYVEKTDYTNSATGISGNAITVFTNGSTYDAFAINYGVGATLQSNSNTSRVIGTKMAVSLTTKIANGQAIQTKSWIGFYSDMTSGNVGTGTGTIADAINFYAQAPTFSGTKPIANYGFYCDNMGVSGMTNAYGIYVAAQSGATNNYGVVSMSALNGFGTAAPTAMVEINGDLLFTARGQGITFVGSSVRIERPIATDTLYLVGEDITMVSNNASTGVAISTANYFIVNDNVGANQTIYADPIAGTIAFFAATPVVKQTSGANLTNNVTAGGSDNVIANYTDLTTYATDAAAIRNNIYQLARKLKQINDGLRSYGLFT